ncbi:hypothetical protein PM082_003628 [Marasmius tenuissimus]|nr:hypothetical protein PM082_003628 [Marasmius tenuissimus]
MIVVAVLGSDDYDRDKVAAGLPIRSLPAVAIRSYSILQQHCLISAKHPRSQPSDHLLEKPIENVSLSTHYPPLLPVYLPPPFKYERPGAPGRD